MIALRSTHYRIIKSLWWVIILTSSLCFIRNTLILLYLMFELSLIPILLIILVWGRQPERLSAGLYFLMYTVFFSIPFLIIIIISLSSIPFLGITGSRTIICFNPVFITFSYLPFLVKIPVIGIHFWLPKAHVEASTRGSIILASLLLKLGRYGLVRVRLLISATKVVGRIFLIRRIISRGITIIQSDRKKMIAYRRITHITLLAISPFNSNSLLFIIIIITSLAHGWASSRLFLIGGTIRRFSHSRSLLLSWRESKFSKFILLSGLLLISNASIPPLPSFYPEVFIILSIIISRKGLVLTFLLLSLIVCYYNVLMFLYYSQVKPATYRRGKTFKRGKDIILISGILRVCSLIFLTTILF